MSLTLALLVLALWVPVVVTVHELGHAVMARPAGYRVTSFGVGRGRPLLRGVLGSGVVVYLGRLWLTGGACVAIPLGIRQGPRAALYHAGGGLGQLALAAGLALLPVAWWWVEPVARFNWLVLAWNLVPWRLGGMVSDGWWMLAALRGSGSGGQVFAGRRVIERTLHHEETAGSPLGTWYARLLLLWMDLVTAGASARLDDEHDVLSDVPWTWALDPELLVLQAYVEAESHRLSGRPLGALSTVERVRSEVGAQVPLASADLLAIAEARAWLALDEPRRAREVLVRVAGVGGMVGNDAVAVRCEAALLQAGRTGAQDGRAFDELRLAARQLAARLPAPFLDSAQAVRVLWDAAASLGPAGTFLKTAARRSAARLLSAADPQDRAPLILRMGEAAGLRSPASARLEGP